MKLYLENRQVATSAVLALTSMSLTMILALKHVDFPWQRLAKCWFTGIHSGNIGVLIMVNLCPFFWSTSLTPRLTRTVPLGSAWFHGHRFVGIQSSTRFVLEACCRLIIIYVGVLYCYGPLPVISTYIPIYRLYNPIYNQL